jgi:hypothetical protein
MSDGYSNLYYPGIQSSDFIKYYESFRSKYTPMISKASMDNAKTRLIQLNAEKGIKVNTTEFALHSKLLSVIEYMYGALILVPQFTETYEDDEKRFNAIFQELSSIESTVRKTQQQYVDPLTTPTLVAWETARKDFEWSQSTFKRLIYNFIQMTRSAITSLFPAYSYHNSLLKMSEKLREDIDFQKDKIKGFKSLCSKMKDCDLTPKLNTNLRLYDPVIKELDSLDKEINDIKTLPYLEMPERYYQLKKKIKRIQVVQFDEDSDEWAELKVEFQAIRDDKETLRTDLRIIENKSTEYNTLKRVHAQFEKQYSTFKDFSEMKSMTVMLPYLDEKSPQTKPFRTKPPEESAFSGVIGWLTAKPVQLKQVEFTPVDVMEDFEKFNKEFTTMRDFLVTSITPSNVVDASKKIGEFRLALDAIKKQLVENFPKYEKIEEVLRELVRNNQSIIELRNTVEKEYSAMVGQLDSPVFENLKTDLNTLRMIDEQNSHINTGESLLETRNQLKLKVINLYSELNKYESEKTLDSTLVDLKSKLEKEKESVKSSVDTLRTGGYRISENEYDKKVFREFAMKLHPDKQNELTKSEANKLFSALNSWNESWENIKKIKKEIDVVQDQLRVAKSAKDIRISSEKDFELYKQRVQEIRERLNQQMKDINALQTAVDSWNEKFTAIKTTMEAKAEELYSVMNNNKAEIQKKFALLQTQLGDLEPRIADVKTRIGSQVEASSSVRAKLDKITKTQMEVQEFKNAMNNFDFELPQKGWLGLGKLDISAKQLDARLRSVNERSQRLIQKVQSSIRELWVDVLEAEYTLNNSASIPLVERMWESVTGERYAKMMGHVLEKSGGLAGKSEAEARTEIQKRNAIIAASTVGLTVVLYYLYWKGKHYWKKHRMLKRLDDAKPRLMWIVIQPYSKDTLKPVDVVPSNSQTYPYDAVMDIVRSSLNPSNDLVLKRIKKAKGLEYGIQTYMTLELLPEIQSFLLEELKRNNLTSSKLISQISPQANRIYLPVWAN